MIERANNGTLLLDEIGELSPKLQTKLLHILEKNEIFRLGSVQPIKVNVRFIAATNSNLMKMVKQKKFRADLFYRLNVASFEIPPIRKRSEDIIPLAKYIIDHFNRKYSKSITHLTTETENFLKSAKWQGNVRELSNSIERAMLLKKDSTLSLNDLNSNNFKLSEQTETGKISSAFSFNLNIESGVNMLQEAQKQLIDKALKITEQNISKAAQLLGVPRTSLNFYINKHDLSKKQ